MNRLLPLVLSLLLTTPINAAEPVSIGYVDMQVVLDKSKMGQEAQKALQKKFSGRQQKLAEEEQAIRQLQQTLARDQALMSQAELDKKNAEIRERIQALQRKAARMQRELAQEQNKLGSAILKPAQEIVTALAKDRQVFAVFERRQSGLLYIDEGLDLTAEVIKRLNAKEKD